MSGAEIRNWKLSFSLSFLLSFSLWNVRQTARAASLLDTIKWTADIIAAMSQPPLRRREKKPPNNTRINGCARESRPHTQTSHGSHQSPSRRLISTGQPGWQGAIGHPRHHPLHPGPPAAHHPTRGLGICRTASPSITQPDGILRESWGSGAWWRLPGWSAHQAGGDEGRGVSFPGLLFYFFSI